MGSTGGVRGRTGAGTVVPSLSLDDNEDDIGDGILAASGVGGGASGDGSGSVVTAPDIDGGQKDEAHAVVNRVLDVNREDTDEVGVAGDGDSAERGRERGAGAVVCRTCDGTVEGPLHSTCICTVRHNALNAATRRKTLKCLCVCALHAKSVCECFVLQNSINCLMSVIVRYCMPFFLCTVMMREEQ